MFVYRGARTPRGNVVTVDGMPLELAGEASPVYRWGYCCPEAAKLGRAMAEHYCRNHPEIRLSEQLAENLMWCLVVVLPRDNWEQTEEQVREVMRSITDRGIAKPIPW